MNSSNQWKVGEAMFCLQSEGLKVHGPSLRSCFSFVTWQDSEEDPKSLREDKDIGKERTLILNDCAAENTQPYPLPILISFLLIFMSIVTLQLCISFCLYCESVILVCTCVCVCVCVCVSRSVMSDFL